MSVLKLPDGTCVEVTFPKKVLDLLQVDETEELVAISGGIGLIRLARADSKRPGGFDYKTISDLLKSVVKAGGAPYVAIHAPKAAVLPVDFDVSRYNGLLFCHMVRSDGSSQLFSYWRSKNAFTDHSDSFVSEYTTGNLVASSGAFADFYPKKKRWFLKSEFWTPVITAAAIVGAVVGLWEQAAQLVEKPDVDIQLSADHPVNLLSTDSGAPIKFSATNRCRFAATRVDIEATFKPLAPRKTKDIDITQKVRLSRIEPGTSKDFLVSTKLAPDPAAQDTIPAGYAFHIGGSSLAGWFWTELIDSTFPPITVWHPIAGTAPPLAIGTNGRCLAQGVLYSGLQQAATIRVTASNPKKVIESISITLTVNGNTRSSKAAPDFKSARGYTARQELTVPTLDRFRSYDYTVDVGLQRMTPGDCSASTFKPTFLGGAPL